MNVTECVCHSSKLLLGSTVIYCHKSMACVDTMLPSPTTLQLESLPKTREISPDEGHMMLRSYHCERCHYKQSKRYYHKYSNRPFIQTSTLFLCKAGCKFRASFIRRTEKIDGKRKPVGGNYLHHFIPHAADCCVSTHTLNSKVRRQFSYANSSPLCSPSSTIHRQEWIY